MSTQSRRRRARGGTRVESVARAANRPRVWFGPGTVLAVLLAAGALIFMNSRPHADSGAWPGAAILAPDPHGGLRRVDGASAAGLPNPSRPLWKPEVSLLVDRAPGLVLTSGQRSEIAILDREWRQDRAGLEASIQRAATGADGALVRPNGQHRASLPLIQAAMSDCSQLSREYDAHRASYWLRAFALLSREQRTRVDHLAVQTAPRRQK